MLALPLDGLDALDAEHEDRRAGKYNGCGNHERPVVLPCPINDPSREPGRRHPGEVGEAVLQAGPFSRRPWAGECLRDGKDLRRIDPKTEARCEQECDGNVRVVNHRHGQDDR